MEIEITHNELRQVIRTAYTKRLPTMIWGTTGVGKSEEMKASVVEIAQVEKREFVEWNKLSDKEKDVVKDNLAKYFILFDVRLSQYDSTDVKGLPKIDAERVVKWLIPDWLDLLTNDQVKAVVFFDEINLAPPSVQASAYQIIRDRALGNITLADGVAVFGAGNRAEDKAHVFTMAKPLANRFLHVTLQIPSVEQWFDWAEKNKVDDRIITFLQFKPTALMRFNPDDKDNSFPTPRSWGEYTNQLIDGITYDNPMFEKFVASAIGSGTAVEFTAFLKLQEQIDFPAILKNPKAIQDIKEIDMLWSLIGIIGKWYEQHSELKDSTKLMEMIEQLPPEFAISTLRLAKKHHHIQLRNHSIKIDVWVKKLAHEYGKYLSD